MIHRNVDKADRPFHGRLQAVLLGVGLSGSVLLYGAGQAGALGGLIAALPLLLGAALCILLASSGWFRETAGAAVACGAGLIGLFATAVQTSPWLAVLVAAALVFECWWVVPSRRSLLVGTGMAAAGLGVGFAAADSGLFIANGAPTAILLAPAMFWALLIAARSSALLTHLRGKGTVSPAEHSMIDDRMDALAEAVLVFDADGQLLEASRRLSAMSGLSRPFLLEGGFFERLHLGDRVVWLNALADLRDGLECAELSLRLRIPVAKGYGRFLMRLRRTEDGRIMASLSDGQSSGERDAEVTRLRTQIDDVGRSKSKFLATVSHELRTPLNAIIGFAELMEDDQFEAIGRERAKEYSALIRQSGEHLLKVVNAILDVSKIESGSYAITPEPFDLAEAIDIPLSMVAATAEAKRLTLVNRVDEGVVLDADRRAVQQILINLLSNAVKFTEAGGSITVDARTSGQRCAIEVMDTGVGIAPDDLPRLCTPFTQLDNEFSRSQEGTGLGLSLVKGLVELHGGDIRFVSEPGKGTTVTVALPLAVGLEEPVDLNAHRNRSIERKSRSDEGGAEGRRNVA